MKHRVLKLMVFLLAGAIINVAVAWGCVVVSDDENRIGVSISRLVGAGGGFFQMESGIPFRAFNGMRVGGRRWDAEQETMILEITTNTFWTFSFKNRQMLLPIRPLLPGFAINTIFYAAVLWVLFAAPGAIRRWRRIKRGQCASCGYSLRGTPHIEKCPECGGDENAQRTNPP